MFSQKALFLMLLNMFFDKIPSTGINLVRFYFQGLITIDFLVKCINYQNVTRLCNVYALGPKVTYCGPMARPKGGLLRSQGCTQG